MTSKKTVKKLIEQLIDKISKLETEQVSYPITYIELYGILNLFLKEIDWEEGKNESNTE